MSDDLDEDLEETVELILMSAPVWVCLLIVVVMLIGYWQGWWN